jgi:hypothetical protein
VLAPAVPPPDNKHTPRMREHEPANQVTCASRSRSRIAARRRSSSWASDVVMFMVSGRRKGSGLVPVAVAPKLVKGGWNVQCHGGVQCQRLAGTGADCFEPKLSLFLKEQ